MARFERLAVEYPSMVMQLMAIVSRRFHQNTTGADTRKRPAPSIICLRLLDDTVVLLQRSVEIIQVLKVHGNVMHLQADNLSGVGAPDPSESGANKMSEVFHDWFSEQESLHRFIVLSCAPEQSMWTDFCEAQSDLILLLADFDSSHLLRNHELSSVNVNTHAKHKVLVITHPSQTISNTKAWIDER